MGTTVARNRGVASKPNVPQPLAPAKGRESLDPEDASRLSFLAYTIEHYKEVSPVSGEVQELVDGLKTAEAHKIAAALQGGKTDPSTANAANVFRGWIRANAKR